RSRPTYPGISWRLSSSGRRAVSTCRSWSGWSRRRPAGRATTAINRAGWRCGCSRRSGSKRGGTSVKAGSRRSAAPGPPGRHQVARTARKALAFLPLPVEGEPPRRMGTGLTHEALQIAFHLGDAIMGNLLELETIVPPEPLHRRCGGQAALVGRRQAKAPGVNARVFLQEIDALVTDLDQPTVVRQPGHPRALDTRGRFEGARGHLDVSALADSDHFGADPQGIPDVFERVRTDHEVEVLVWERKGVFGADVALDPGVEREPLAFASLRGEPAEGAIEAPRLIGLHVHHPLRPVEGTGPTADLEHQVVGLEPLEQLSNVRFVQSPSPRSHRKVPARDLPFHSMTDSNRRALVPRARIAGPAAVLG